MNKISFSNYLTCYNIANLRSSMKKSNIQERFYIRKSMLSANKVQKDTWLVDGDTEVVHTLLYH